MRTRLVDSVLVESMDVSLWQEMVERVTRKVLVLESLTESVSEEMQIRKAIREEWSAWNETWKSAWLLSQDEGERMATSVQFRVAEEKKSFPKP